MLRFQKNQSSFASNSPRQLDVLWHNSDPLGVDSAQIGVFKEISYSDTSYSRSTTESNQPKSIFIYRIKCKDCDPTYLGKIIRILHYRINEHKL